MGLKEWGADLLAMVYPRLCEVCGEPLVRTESVMCLHCRLAMPRVRISDYEFNEMHRRVAAPGVPVERAAAYFIYAKGGDYSRLIHAAKYHGRPSVGRYLAAEFAGRLVDKGFFGGIDCIVPVPVYLFKRLRRGYNQTEDIARGISGVTGIAVDARILNASRGHSSQTHRSGFERWLNTVDVFEADGNRLARRSHILIVDDVMTTGATLLACARAVVEANPSVKISLLTLGLTGD